MGSNFFLGNFILKDISTIFRDVDLQLLMWICFSLKQVCAWIYNSHMTLWSHITCDNYKEAFSIQCTQSKQAPMSTILEACYIGVYTSNVKQLSFSNLKQCLSIIVKYIMSSAQGIFGSQYMLISCYFVL